MGHRGPPLPRRHRRALVRERRLRARGDRRGRGGADAPPARVLALRRRLHPPHHALAERIAAVAPMDDAVVFFTSGGGESIETAAKLVPPLLEPRRPAREDGRSSRASAPTTASPATARASSAPRPSRPVVGPLVGDTLRVPWDSAEALAAAIDEIGPERVAAFFCEPIIGAGGVLLPPEGYLRAACSRCAATATCCSSWTR